MLKVFPGTHLRRGPAISGHSKFCLLPFQIRLMDVILCPISTSMLAGKMAFILGV